jgi:hypothetical protein
MEKLDIGRALEQIPQQQSVESAGIDIAEGETNPDSDRMTQAQYDDLEKLMHAQMKAQWAEKFTPKWKANRKKKNNIAKASRKRNRKK